VEDGVEDRVRWIMGDVFEMDGEEFTDNSSPETIVLWDSLNHLKLVTEIEKIFEVRLTMAEIRSMTTFRRIKEVLKLHLDVRVPVEHNPSSDL
jgi:acyl carrier protein